MHGEFRSPVYHNRIIRGNREVRLIVRRHESLKVITLIEAVVAMVLVTIAALF
jgi:hypothetical protein